MTDYELFKDALNNRRVDVITGTTAGAVHVEFSILADDNFSIYFKSNTAGYIEIFAPFSKKYDEKQHLCIEMEFCSDNVKLVNKSDDGSLTFMISSNDSVSFMTIRFK
jgi:hypothetical protein